VKRHASLITNLAINLVISMLLIFLSACDQKASPEKSSNTQQTSSKTTIKPAQKIAYREIEWTELIPADDLEALLNPPDYLNAIQDGSMEDQIAGQIKAQLDIDSSDPYQQALVSTKVIDAMNGEHIRIPGFLVPLAFGEKEFEITQFFLVPFFGACLHVPPPPPNQIIFVDHPEGVTLTSLQDAFWLEGKLSTSLTENDTAISAYSLELHTIKPYYEVVE